jgi:hypothetical protein
MQGWDCISVPTICAPGLGDALMRWMGMRVRYLDDIYFHLVQPVPSIQRDMVQRLTLADLPLLEVISPELHVDGFGSLEALLNEGIVAGALVDGQLVAIALSIRALRTLWRHRDRHTGSLAQPRLCDCSGCTRRTRRAGSRANPGVERWRAQRCITPGCREARVHGGRETHICDHR